VEEFVRCIADYSGDLDLSQGRMVVDAKSILGVCSLNMGDEMELQVHGGNIDELKTKIERFLR
jgi:phosphotransferase system HPr-like phosphotransfer protein